MTSAQQTHPGGDAGEHGRPNEFHIVVNSRPKVVTSAELTFEEVVRLAYDPPPSGPDVTITVTYRNAEGKESGTLAPGQAVTVRNGTSFNVRVTDKS